MIEQLLPQVPLLASLPREEIRYLAETLRLVELPAQTILFHENDRGDHLYIVLEGQLEVIKALGTSDERILSLRMTGESVGEMSLLNPDGQRTATVRARTKVRLLEMTRADFDALLHRHPPLAYDLARILSTHLRETDIAMIRDLHDKNRALTEAYHDLQVAQAQLVEKEALERELRVAREIQMSMLPRSLPVLAGFEFGAHILPTRAVGGDFFDFIPLDENTLALLIGDVSGKGVPAALFMAVTCTLLRAETSPHTSPRAVLENVNRRLLERNDTGMFVTLFYGILDRRSRELCYVRAGHELPFLLDARGMETPLMWGAGQPLGILDAPAFDQQTLTLPPDGTLLLYTDGATDAMDTSHDFFGAERLHQAVQANCVHSPQQMCDNLLRTILDHQSTAPQADDITLVAVRAR